MPEINSEDLFSMTGRQLIKLAEEMGAVTMTLKVNVGDKPVGAIVVVLDAVPEILAAIDKAEQEAGVGE